MLYKFDKDQLLWKKNWKGVRYLILVFITLISIAFISGRYLKLYSLDSLEKELIVLNIQTEKNKFSKEKFVSELKRLNIKYPYIVMAQSIVETGNWKSSIFKENHNLFGMKQASVRINTASGTQNNHAYYETWMESIYDYAFYQCRYLSNLQSEEAYYAYLQNSYAEDPNYVKILKSIVQREQLKALFQ
jgi:hypothetical protein